MRLLNKDPKETIYRQLMRESRRLSAPGDHTWWCVYPVLSSSWLLSLLLHAAAPAAAAAPANCLHGRLSGGGCPDDLQQGCGQQAGQQNTGRVREQ